MESKGQRNAQGERRKKQPSSGLSNNTFRILQSNPEELPGKFFEKRDSLHYVPHQQQAIPA